MLEKTLESPLDTRRSNQSILKEINPEYSLEGLMLKLKLQYFGYLMWRADSLEETLMLGKIEGRRRRRWQRMRCLDGIPDTMDMNLSKLQEMVKNREAWHAVVHGVTKSGMTEWLNSDTTKVMRKASSLSLFFNERVFCCCCCFLAALGLGYCAQSFSICSERGATLPWYTGFSLQWFLIAEHRLQAVHAPVVVACRL